MKIVQFQTVSQIKISNFLYSFLQLFSTQIISIFILIILTRILSPKDFGLMALTLIFIQLSQVIIDFGFSHSIIRNLIDDKEELSTILFISILISIILYLVLYIMAPLFAALFNNSNFIIVLRLQAISLIFFSISNFYNNLSTRFSMFKIQFWTSFISISLSTIISIIIAIKGQGIWSLVSFAVTQPFFNAMFYLMFHDWTPNLIFNFNKLRPHIEFCKYITFSGSLDILFTNLNQILIGKFYPLNILGFYNRAETLKQIPVSNITLAINKVSYPILSGHIKNATNLKILYSKLIKLSFFILSPIICFMIVFSEDIIFLLFTEKWKNSVIFFKILSISSFLYPLHVFNLNILTLLGKSVLFLKLEVIKKIIGFGIILSAFYFGLTALAWSQVIISIIFVFINSFYSKKLINYSIVQQLRDIMPLFLTFIILFIILDFSKNLLLFNIGYNFYRMIIGLILIVCFYILGMVYLKKINFKLSI